MKLPENLIKKLNYEIVRNNKILEGLGEVRTEGIASILIMADIRSAKKAISSKDTAEMLRTYRGLKYND